MREDIRTRLADWDSGEAVWSVEMGGIGPGYEQAIQVLAIEPLRDNEVAPTEDTWPTWGDATVSRIDRRLPDGRFAMGGFSGAQVGAAKQIASMMLRLGVDESLEKAPEDRKILVSKNFPGVAPCA